MKVPLILFGETQVSQSEVGEVGYFAVGSPSGLLDRDQLKAPP